MAAVGIPVPLLPDVACGPPAEGWVAVSGLTEFCASLRECRRFRGIRQHGIAAALGVSDDWRPETPERIRRSVASRLGMTLVEYDVHRAAGERWCSGCRGWHPVAEFGPTAGYCRPAQRRRQRDGLHARSEEFRNWLLARVLVK